MTYDWRVTIWQDEEDLRGGTYSVALERRPTREGLAPQAPGTGWTAIAHRTVFDHAIAWRWATDKLEEHGTLPAKGGTGDADTDARI